MPRSSAASSASEGRRSRDATTRPYRAALAATNTPTSLGLVGRQPSPTLQLASSTAASVGRQPRVRSPHPYGGGSAASLVGARGPAPSAPAAAVAAVQPSSSGAPSCISAHDVSWDASRDSLVAHPYQEPQHTQGEARAGSATASGRKPAVSRGGAGDDAVSTTTSAMRGAPPSTVAISDSPSAPAQRPASSVASSPAVTVDPFSAITAVNRNEGSLFRQIYNEKLRSSVQSIIHSLTIELPADHVFAQLMSDPTTMTYSKVRLAEVVEVFLYATQAQQFHNLAAELARQHEELLLTQQELAQLRQQQQQQQEALGGLGESETVGKLPPAEYRTPHRAGDASATILATSATPYTSGGDNSNNNNDNNANTGSAHAAAGGSSPGSSLNPMSDDSARQALLRLLEDTTRDHELERSRQSLVAPDRLIEVAAQNWTSTTRGSGEEDGQSSSLSVTNKVDYLSGVMAELYRSVSGLLYYVDGSLESLDALRNDLERYSQPSVGVEASQDAYLVHTPMNTTTQSAREQPQQRISTLKPPPAAAEERKHVRTLLDQLRDAQVRSARALDRLAQDAAGLAQREATAMRAVAVAQQELKVATAAAEGAQQLQGTMERLRDEYRRASAAEREDAHAQIEELRTQLQQAEAALAAAHRDAQAHEELSHELAATQAAREDAEHRASVAEKDIADRRARDAELQAVVGSLQKDGALLRRELDSCEAELLCAQVELHMTQLECSYRAHDVEKHELMERHGYGRLVRDYSILSQVQAEAARHQQVQAQLAETATLQKDLARQQVQSDLSALLQTMWRDEDGDSADEAGQDGATAVGGHAAVVVQARHRMPTTLAGTATALTYAYAGLQRQHRAHLEQLAEMRDATRDKEARVAAVEATNAELQAALDAARAQAQQLRADLDALSTNNPMKALLARQEALLSSVSDERAMMRDRWGSLNKDYIALERRNAELHARCVGKEHENAKLNGLIRSMNSSPTKVSNNNNNSTSFTPAPAEPAAATSPVPYVATRTVTATSTASDTPPSLPRRPATSSTAPAVTGSSRLPATYTPRPTTTTSSVDKAAAAQATTTSSLPPSTSRVATGARLVGSPGATPTNVRAQTQSSSNGAGAGVGRAVDRVARVLLTPDKK